MPVPEACGVVMHSLVTVFWWLPSLCNSLPPPRMSHILTSVPPADQSRRPSSFRSGHISSAEMFFPWRTCNILWRAKWKLYSPAVANKPPDGKKSTSSRGAPCWRHNKCDRTVILFEKRITKLKRPKYYSEELYKSRVQTSITKFSSSRCYKS